MSPPPKLLCQLASKPRPQGRLRKRPDIENKVEHEDFVEVEAPNKSTVRTEGLYNQIQKPKIDLGGILSKNLSAEELVKPALEFAKSVIETSSKVREPKTYDKAISNLIHGNKWRKAIDEEFSNLDLHQTWSYSTLPSRQKIIGCKWVFKLKYYPDTSIKRYKARLVAQNFS